MLTLADYAAEWIKHRNMKPHNEIEYTALLDRHIAPMLGRMAIRDLNPEAVRTWYSGLGRDHVRRNSHADGPLHAIYATVVKDRLLQSNPCQIERVMNPPTKREPVILTVPEVAALAEAVPDQFTA